jgi:hypothetical protein
MPGWARWVFVARSEFLNEALAGLRAYQEQRRMAQKRSSQRGVVKVASSFLLAGLGALLGISGCAADDRTVTATDAAESVGVSTEALVCGTTTCNVDDCTAYKCGLGNTCTLVSAQKDGEPCKNINGGVGLCVTLMTGQAPICCTGCIQRLKTGGYACMPGREVGACGTQGEACADCSGTNKCATYACVPEKFVCDTNAIPDGMPCTDNSGVCTGGSCCPGCVDGNGVCQPGNTVSQCGVSSPQNGLVKCKSCDDGNICNNDSCVSGVCAAPTPKAGNCPDATVCNGAEVCGNGTCNPGTPLNCNDNNPCTVDSCDPVLGCKHVAVEAGTSCDNDANKCNGTAKCDGTECKPLAAVDCDDGNICTTDSCTAATGVCVHTNNTLDCSDNNLCTLVDKCSGGTCMGSGEPNCNDNEACTTDSCDRTKGCLHAAVAENTPCDDGNDCSTGDKCIAGKCSFVMGKDCNDNNPCTKDSCSANVCGPVPENDTTPCVFDRCHINSECQAGKCSQGDAINCDDGNPCTTDSCDAASGCKHVNADGGDCSDNDACTTADKCAGGKCVGTQMTCKPIDECHLAGTCNAKTGTCDDPRAPDDTECDQGAGTCQTGKCETTSMGGAGGETSTGDAGQGTGGTAVAQGGEPTTGSGGEGNSTTTGGTEGGGTGGTAGKGSGTGATTSNGEGGDPEVPAHVFVRDPGGCSCHVLGTPKSTDLTWLAGLGLAALVAGRRRSRRAGERRVP